MIEGLFMENLYVSSKIKIPTAKTANNNKINSVTLVIFLSNEIPKDQSSINGVIINTLITSPTHHGIHVITYCDGIISPPKRRLVTPKVALTIAANGAATKKSAKTSLSLLIEVIKP